MVMVVAWWGITMYFQHYYRMMIFRPRKAKERQGRSWWLVGSRNYRKLKLQTLNHIHSEWFGAVEQGINLEFFGAGDWDCDLWGCPLPIGPEACSWIAEIKVRQSSLIKTQMNQPSVTWGLGMQHHAILFSWMQLNGVSENWVYTLW